MKKIAYITFILSYVYFIDAFTMKLFMPGVTPTSEDQYICSSFPIPKSNQESYIVSYEPIANSSIAHHILLFGCVTPSSSEPSYPCHSICEEGQEKIIFAWARDAHKFEYPSDTGMAVGGKTNIRNLVLQVHYLKPENVKDSSGLLLTLTEKIPKNSVSIFLLFSYYGDIKPKTKKAHLDISCKYQGSSEAYTLAFRTHAHALGRSISGFKVSVTDDEIELIGKANPQWPQTFYKANQVLIKPDDILMARCLFDSRDRNRVTHIGSTHHDEMCNFYIMLVSKNNGEINNFLSCGGDEFKDLWKNIPSYSMDYDPSNPTPELFLTKTAVSGYGDGIKSLKAEENWKINRRLGEVSGATVLQKKDKNADYTLFVLHRGSHQWTASSFSQDIFQGDFSHPISDNVILEIDPKTGNVLREAGKNLFFLPHGITITKDGKYVWVTDVALHQIMRFNIREDTKLIDENPSIVIGEKFVPGNDQSHFCKPAKVVVDSRGYIFVADGYCNKRVVCFSPNGTYFGELRAKESMFIVHSITIEEDQSGDFTNNVIWVADRENMKVIGFNYDGTVKASFSPENSYPIYGIEYNPTNHLIYGITSNGNDKGKAFTFNTTSQRQVKSWNSNYPFHSPHDLCLAENGRVIFIAELYEKRIIKFHRDGLISNSPTTNNGHFNQIHRMVKKINPVLIGILLLLAMVCVVICVVSMKYLRYCKLPNVKVRRYGHAYNDKEGFRPLTQEDDGNDGNSDPETEEYATPRGHLLRKPKA